MKINELTIKQIEELLKQVTSLGDDLLTQLKNDPRIGVQKAVGRRIRQINKQNKEKEEFNNRLSYEKSIYQTNPNAVIAGVDEVGRGPLAGPVVACAVILPVEPVDLIGVNDSKTLSSQKRSQFEEKIKHTALDYSYGTASVEEIDQLNILQATKLAMIRAVKGLKISPDHLLIDALELDIPLKQTKIIKGDDKSLSIASASILAKEYRDRLMRELSNDYPEFSFETNMGYGSKDHLSALEKFGKTPLHRESFSPVSKIQKTYSK